MPASGSAHRPRWWNRKPAESAPHRSITMKEDDLDHLGTHHDLNTRRIKR
jgi:hypothetical protein